MELKKISIIILSFSLLILLMPKAYAFSGYGDGSPSDPYSITNYYELNEIRNNIGACYILEDNIDMGYEAWEPVGSYERPFHGSIDGNGFKIKNFQINDNSGLENHTKGIGLIGYGKKAILKNVIIQN